MEKRSGKHLSDLEKSLLFSGRHVSDPENFTFVYGERVVIKNISDHVKKVLKRQNRFDSAPPERYFKQINLIQTVVGLIFGQDQSLKMSTESFSHKDKAVIADRKSLLASIEKLNIKYKSVNGLIDVPKISEENITIDRNNKGNIVASVKCVFCTKSVKVSKKQSSCTWVLSNMKRHIEKSCKILQNAPTELDNPLADQDMKPETNALVKLEIEPVIQNIEEKLNDEFTSYMENLRTQLKLQKIKMISSVIINGETQRTCEIYLDSKESNIEVSETAPDGNCPFSAISHQLADLKIGSPEHTLASNRLRKDTVTHIKENLHLYELDIKGRFYERSSEKKIYDFPKRCEIFLDESLASDGFWGGIESVKAIARMMETNIIIFNEKGEVNFGNRYDPNYKRSIMVAFRITDHQNNDLSNSNRNHYDSVTKVCDQIISESAKKLIRQYLNSCTLKEDKNVQYVG